MKAEKSLIYMCAFAARIGARNRSTHPSPLSCVCIGTEHRRKLWWSKELAAFLCLLRFAIAFYMCAFLFQDE